MTELILSRVGHLSGFFLSPWATVARTSNHPSTSLGLILPARQPPQRGRTYLSRLCSEQFTVSTAFLPMMPSFLSSWSRQCSAISLNVGSGPTGLSKCFSRPSFPEVRHHVRGRTTGGCITCCACSRQAALRKVGACCRGRNLEQEQRNP